jgi:hypothetical protein
MIVCMEAIIEPNRIVIMGTSSLPRKEWETLLDDLRAEHVPAFTPTGKRMAVAVSPGGRIDAFIYRTNYIPDGEVVRILSEHNIPSRVQN